MTRSSTLGAFDFPTLHLVGNMGYSQSLIDLLIINVPDFKLRLVDWVDCD